MNMFRPPGSSTLPRFRPVDHRKRVKAVAITLAVCAALGTAAWSFGVKNGEPLTYACDRDDYVAPTPDPVKVNVFNGSGLPGLAVQVKGQLEARGFVTDRVENDPIARKIRGTGEVRYGPDAEFTNILNALRSWQPGVVLVKEPRRNGPQVDFVMGLKFESLLEKAVPPPDTPKGECKPDEG